LIILKIYGLDKEDYEFEEEEEKNRPGESAAISNASSTQAIQVHIGSIKKQWRDKQCHTPQKVFFVWYQLFSFVACPS